MPAVRQIVTEAWHVPKPKTLKPIIISLAKTRKNTE